MAASSSFFSDAVGVGAVLAGFCGTFLSFRIQREAGYHRQPALSYDDRKAKDVPIGLTHFTSAFSLLLLATLCAMLSGVVVPLLALAGLAWAQQQVGAVTAGLVATLFLLLAYFLDELIHYRILTGRLANDAREWGTEWYVVLGGIVFASAAGYAAFILVRTA